MLNASGCEERVLRVGCFRQQPIRSEERLRTYTELQVSSRQGDLRSIEGRYCPETIRNWPMTVLPSTAYTGM